ncbi:GAF and ANTAR domain-containing protein [Solicola sp. PLA-1-18]|uniref:GAF and ANTAR domain-containing protein n=1 Tax=Solicola sp. PLA-1-18 TaxID=3380532 RepID=UPI003B7EA3B7
MSADLRTDLAVLARELSQGTGLSSTVEQVVEFARRTFGATEAGITLIRDGRLETVAATSPAVRSADEAQHELGEGPCVEAATESRTVWSGDLGTDDRWPTWGPRAVELGFVSVLATEMHAGGRRVGALNLYRATSGPFDPEDASLAQDFAQHSAVALSHLLRIDHLEVALSTRTLIGQAQGILMERHGVDAERAFSILRRYSQDENVKLRDVAQRLVLTSRLEHPRRPGAPGPRGTS